MRIWFPANKFWWIVPVSPKEINLSEHCLNCLTRKRSGMRFYEGGGILEIPQNLFEIKRVYYICGLSRPYKWENNTHFVFKCDSESGTKVFSEFGINKEPMFVEYCQVPRDDPKSEEIRRQILTTNVLPRGLTAIGNFVTPPKDCFSEKYIPADFPNRDNALFRTCRNWRFAHWAVSHPEFFTD